MRDNSSIADLATCAKDGDSQAWDGLVDRFGKTGEHARSAGAEACCQGPLVSMSHVHPWSLSPVGRRDPADCELCRATRLKLIVSSSAWVVRCVDHVDFIDESIVRRRFSIDNCGSLAWRGDHRVTVSADGGSISAEPGLTAQASDGSDARGMF